MVADMARLTQNNIFNSVPKPVGGWITQNVSACEILNWTIALEVDVLNTSDHD